MSRHGRGPSSNGRAGTTLLEMDDDNMRALIVACFEILAEREGRDILDVVDDCRNGIEENYEAFDTGE